MPELAQERTDLEKRRFLREAFRTITQYFEYALDELSATNPGEVNHNGTSALTTEIFQDGNSRARCKIWISNQLGEGIAYYEGNDWLGNNAMNEILVVSDKGRELFLTAQMGVLAFGKAAEGYDLGHLSPTEGANTSGAG